MNKKGVTVFLFILSLLCGYSQSPYFKNYPLLKKNESVRVNRIFQDKVGFIWYGTDKGLFKFDGINLKRFTTTDSLPDNYVMAIAEDSLGRVWTGHKNGQLAFIKNDVVQKFIPQEGSASQPVSDILFDKKGNLWFSTLNDGLYYFIEQRLYRLDAADGMPDLFIYDITEDKQGRIWAGTDGGAVVCTLKDKKVTLEVLSYKQGLPDNIIKKLFIDSDNTIWMATEDAGIIHYDATKKVNTLIEGEWKYGSISDFAVSSDHVWIATLQNGLVVYDRTTKLMRSYNPNEKQDAGIATINDLLRDREGNIWVGTKTGLTRTYGDYITYIENVDPSKDLNIVALTVDQEGNTWFANSEGLFRRSETASERGVIEKQLTGTPFQKFTVISLYTDDHGYIWAGLYGEGVLRIHPQTGKIQYLNKELRNGNILNITGRNDDVWLATLGGASRIKISGGQLEVKNYSSANGLSSDYIYQVFIDSKDRVWFATDGKGVDVLDASGFHHYSDGLDSKVIYGFAEDGNHTLWVNAHGDGLYQLDGDVFKLSDRWSHLRERNIGCLSSDPAGNLVVMHDLGIDVYEAKSNRVRYFRDEVGLDEREPNLNAIAKDKYGRLFIGTDRGIVVYSTPGEKFSEVPLPGIQSLKVFDKGIPISDGQEFRYDENNITLNYNGFWYQNPENVNFQYRMENYDVAWITSRDRFAVYSSLPPGEYTFQLKASDNDDFKESKQASFHFVIHPPFWRTIPFYIAVVLAIVFVGYSIIKYRERQLIQDKQLLEAKVEERTLEIQKQNEEILTQTEEIQSMNDNLEELVEERTSELEKKNKALEEYAFITAHNLRAPVASILGLVNLASKLELKEGDKEIISHLNDSAQRLDAIVQSITEAIEKGDS